VSTRCVCGVRGGACSRTPGEAGLPSRSAEPTGAVQVSPSGPSGASREAVALTAMGGGARRCDGPSERSVAAPSRREEQRAGRNRARPSSAESPGEHERSNLPPPASVGAWRRALSLACASRLRRPWLPSFRRVSARSADRSIVAPDAAPRPNRSACVPEASARSTGRCSSPGLAPVDTQRAPGGLDMGYPASIPATCNSREGVYRARAGGLRLESVWRRRDVGPCYSNAGHGARVRRRIPRVMSRPARPGQRVVRGHCRRRVRGSEPIARQSLTSRGRVSWVCAVVVRLSCVAAQSGARS
jgi:hypothetical protein